MKGKYESTAKKSSKKGIALLLVLFLLVGCVIGTTLAWLTDKTTSITNTFTVGVVDIDLTETDRTYKLVPGETLPKDPKVIVNAGSEACWVFVKIDKANNVDTYIDYSIATAWTQLKNGVYYIDQNALTDANSQNAEYSVLLNNAVTVKSTLEAADLTAASTNAPTLTFTAYAIQKDATSINTAMAAWNLLETEYNNP